jgi:hypothetical protein
MKFRTLRFALLLLALAVLPGFAVGGSPQLVNGLVIPGETTDLYQGAAGANFNRLGGFFSDLHYDRQNGTLYGLADRGPGGGVISYETRFQKFKVNVDHKTGAISNFRLQATILFRTADGSQAFNGLSPDLLNGDKRVLGLSFDPEGITFGPQGQLYVSDEYGPSLYEFRLVETGPETIDARFVRAFTIPDNLIPREGALLNFVDGRGVLTSGRQDNRGFEGLTISNDGTTLYAILQDPLIQEGASNDGRRSRNVRLTSFDVASGQPLAQYIYQLEPIADINARIPGTANDFGATSQGRNIGVSAITTLNDTEFLVLERDNRGIGVGDPLGTVPVGSKRIYRINTAGATDVKNVSLAGTNSLPDGVTPVSKSLFLDIAGTLSNAGLPVPEKMEGLALGLLTRNGKSSTSVLFTGTDNDFSVTQDASNVQFDVYTDGSQGPIDGPSMGRSLIPTFMFSFAGEIPGYSPAPEH